MLSVLIQNKKTIESFNEYYPLFLEAIENQEVAVCRWYETGSTIDTALPELIDITDSVEEWRAIIIQTQGDSSRFKTNPKNPYDYIDNANSADEITESDIPLIRLTHILGGVPAPEVKFETIIIPGTKKSTERIIYAPVKDEIQEQRHKELCEKYKFDGKLPKEIILITLREKSVKEQDDAKNAWETFEEINTSEFWKRNKYPSICRFIVFDINQHGKNERESKRFNFWMSTLLLSTNQINPSALQAYRLYRFETEFNKAQMKETFQRKIEELAGARHFLEEEIKRDIEKKITEKKELPAYHVDVPVSVDMPKYKDFEVKNKKFRLVANTTNEDFNTWNTLESNILHNLDRTVINSERAVNEATDRMRHRFQMADDGYVELGRYQREDLNNELHDIYCEIIDTQCSLSNIKNKYRKQLEKPDADVRERIRFRLTGGTAIGVFATAILTIFIFVLIAFYPYSQSQNGSLKGILTVLGVFSFATLIVELIVILLDRVKFKDQIIKFNVALDKCVTDICLNNEKFSRFITNIASYSRGKSYLEAIDKKKFRLEHGHYLQEEHIKEINSFLEKIKRWSNANYLNNNFEFDCFESILVDYELPAKKYFRYTFDYNSTYDVPVNNTGSSIQSKFDFVKKFYLEREELYNE